MLLLTVLLVASTAPAAAGEVPVEVYPSPVGYTYEFSMQPGRIYGIKVGGKYLPSRADPGAGYAVFPAVADEVVTAGATLRLKVISPLELLAAYGIDLPGPDDLVVFSGGLVYLSRYDIRYSVPGEAEGNVLVIMRENYLRVPDSARVSILLPITGKKISVWNGTRSYTTTLAELLGIPESCIAFFAPKPGVVWTGGILPTPTCLSKIKPIRYDVINNQPFVVVFEAAEPIRIKYVVFARPTARVLSELGILTPVTPERAEALHVLRVSNLEQYTLYLASSPHGLPRRQPVVKAVDFTYTEDGEYICSIDGEVVYYIVWGLRNRTLAGIVELLPGEVVLVRYGENRYYVCRGDMSWLATSSVPTVRIPSYREFPHPVVVTAPRPVLVVLSNGRVWSGRHVVIPYEEYARNTLWVVSSSIIRRYATLPPSILRSPVLWLAVLVGAALAAAIVRRESPPPEDIEIVMDIAGLSPMRIASREIVESAVKEFFDTNGYCPSDMDLAKMGVLTPLDGVEDPEDEIIYCHVKTNVRTESELRKIIRTLTPMFWAVQRIDDARINKGVLYTVVGGRMLFFYLYKQEDETSPARLLVNALKAAYSIDKRIIVPHHKVPLGLVIVATPEMVRRLKQELRFIRDYLQTDTSRIPVEQYSAARGVEVRVSEKLQEFIDKNIGAVVPLSHDNLPELIDLMAEHLVPVAEARRRTEFWSESLLD